MKEQMNALQERFEQSLQSVSSIKEWNDCKVEYFGKKGPLTDLTNMLRDLPVSEKKDFGKALNELKNDLTKRLDQLKEKLEEKEQIKRLEQESIDISLPSTKRLVGALNPLELLVEEMEAIFISMGYDVVEGPEVEKDLYNFELLNLPKGHPARDAQDTFYTKGEELLLRSHTSPVQIRTMLANEEKTPIRIVCPGKTYRRDADDATHSHQFMQIEGLLVDKDISLANLKGTFDVIAKKLYGENRNTRFRPSYYPFTEPSVELDISCFNCSDGCPICKHTGWITVGGAGLVHPNVLNNCGYDSDVYSGFAFGFGLERLAMLKYGITDVRTFYINDLRTTECFNRREAE